MDTPIIACTALARGYALGGGTVRALDGVTVAVARGEFVAVTGPSGSGKSTFMNLVGCLDRPTEGRILLDGEDVSALPPDRLAEIRAKRIGFVFQQFNLLARTTALDNVAMPLIYTGRAGAQGRETARRRLEEVGLGRRLDHTPAQLSGGQQQRVAIARALVNDPAILLADEPTGALDSRTGMEIMELFQRLNRDGLTVLVVTHDPEVAACAGRVLAFRDGRLVEDRRNDRPRDLAAELSALDGNQTGGGRAA